MVLLKNHGYWDKSDNFHVKFSPYSSNYTFFFFLGKLLMQVGVQKFHSNMEFNRINLLTNVIVESFICVD